MLLRVFCVCFSLTFLIGCSCLFKETGESYIQVVDQNEPPIKFKDTAQGALRSKIFSNKVETCQ
jgi:hypothetical protein